MKVAPRDTVQIVQPIQPPLRSGLQDMEPNKKILVDKICRLQRIHAKKNEKLEFMEEHINALVEEIQKKARLAIQNCTTQHNNNTTQYNTTNNIIQYNINNNTIQYSYCSTIIQIQCKLFCS